MKKVKLNFGLIIVLSLITFFTEPAFTQNKSGTTIGQFLKIEPSSRIVAIGNAGASLFGGISSVFYNPASLGRLESNDIEFTYNKWLADITYNYMAAGVKIEGIGTFALIGTMLNSGEMDVRTVEQPLGTGERFSVKNFALGLGYGLMITDRVSVGLQVNYITEMIWHSSLTTVGLNFGVQYQLMDKGLTLGASFSNFGARASYDGRDLWLNYDIDPRKYGDNDQLPAEFRTDAFALPTIFRAGLSYKFSFDKDYSVLIAADAIHQNDNSQSISVGTEISLLEYFNIRAGYRNLFLPDLEGGLVLGGGIKKDIAGSYNIRFDYAYADYGRLTETHRITIGLGF
ncbi:PorV/PorQ family protein [Ignavibacterium album]|uniref:PorV/PorQ family protein n=1 Tax=Ignavibacterium album TaxID=591197 RepID=UPI0035B96BF9